MNQGKFILGMTEIKPLQHCKGIINQLEKSLYLLAQPGELGSCLGIITSWDEVTFTSHGDEYQGTPTYW